MQLVREETPDISLSTKLDLQLSYTGQTPPHPQEPTLYLMRKSSLSADLELEWFKHEVVSSA